MAPRHQGRRQVVNCIEPREGENEQRRRRSSSTADDRGGVETSTAAVRDGVWTFYADSSSAIAIGRLVTAVPTCRDESYLAEQSNSSTDHT
jgi:hypothetical protein